VRTDCSRSAWNCAISVSTHCFLRLAIFKYLLKLQQKSCRQVVKLGLGVHHPRPTTLTHTGARPAHFAQSSGTRNLLQAMRGVLSKQELPAHISRGLEAQLTSEWQDMRAKLSKLDAPVYGTVAATVKVVTADAVTNDKTGISSYPATLTLDQRSMNIDGKQVAISPGMNVTAEIKTGERRVIEFLLSPIQRAGSESLRER
jgi:hypothetical protein